MLNNTRPDGMASPVVMRPESLKIADLDDLADYALHPVPWEITDVTCSAAAAVVTFARCTGLDSKNDLAETAISSIDRPLCARSGRFQHLHALIFGEEFSLHNHADAQKLSGRFFTIWPGKGAGNGPHAAETR